MEPSFIISQQTKPDKGIEIGNVKLDLVVHAINQEVPKHSHEQTHLIFVRSGRMAFNLDGQIQEVRQGDIIVIPPNVPHNFRVIGEQDCNTVCITLSDGT